MKPGRVVDEHPLLKVGFSEAAIVKLNKFSINNSGGGYKRCLMTCWNLVRIKNAEALKQASDEIFLAGGCLWGVQEFVRHLPGVLATEAGRANGSSQSIEGAYDGYAECVRTSFDANQLSVVQLMRYFFEIIDPYSINRQGPDVGEKYRTGVYSRAPAHLAAARRFIEGRKDAARIAVEVLPLRNYLRSAPEHQDRLQLHPEEACHLPKALLHKYRSFECRNPSRSV